MKNNKIRLLIVEDDAQLRQTTEELFSTDEDFEVYTAHNGQHGLEVLEIQSIDAILSDIRMPVMSGLVLYQNILLSKSIQPLFFFCSSDYAIDQHFLKEMGVKECFPKPFDFRLMKSQIKSHFERPQPSPTKEFFRFYWPRLF